VTSNLLDLSIVLYEPEIPPNTGNLIRLCSNTGVKLHLVEPLGFSMDAKSLRRAGLDYHETAQVFVHENMERCFDFLLPADKQRQIFAVSTRGTKTYSEPRYTCSDVLLFGPETRGLPTQLLNDRRVKNTIRIPMKTDSRSLNLSNSVAIVAFEALRQLEFPTLS